MELLTFVTVNGTLKLENRNWKFGLHAFCIVNERIQFWAGFLTIALSAVACDSNNSFLLLILLIKITPPYLITPLPVCKHPTHKLVSLLPNFSFPTANFKP